MHATKLIKQLASDSAVYGLAGVIDKFVIVLLIPLYTRVFSREEVGILSLVDVTFTLVLTTSFLGLDSASARWFYDSQDEGDRRTTMASWFWCQLATGVALGAAMAAFSPWLARWLLGSSDLAPLFWLAAPAVPMNSMLRVWGGWLRYQRRAWSTAALLVVRTVGRVGWILVFVLVFRYSLAGVLLGNLVNMTILGVTGAFALGAWIYPRWFRLGRLKEMLRFGLPLVPAALGIWVMASIDRVLLKMLCGDAEVGLYDMAAKLSGVVALGTLAFQQAWAPFAYSIMNEKGVERVYARVLDVYCLVGCTCATAVGLFGPLLFHILTTKPFYPAASCVPVLAMGYFFVGARFIAELGSGLAKRSAPLAWAIVLGATLNVGLNFALIPLWGRDGAAIATLLAEAVSTTYLFGASQIGHPIPYRWGVFLGCLAAAGGLILAAWAWVPEMGLLGLAVRAAMLLVFVPLGYWLVGIRWVHLQSTDVEQDSPRR